MDRKIEPRRTNETKKTEQRQDKKRATPRNKKDGQPITPTGYHGTDDERTLNPEE
jgi:hypothetical protein